MMNKINIRKSLLRHIIYKMNFKGFCTNTTSSFTGNSQNNGNKIKGNIIANIHNWYCSS